MPSKVTLESVRKQIVDLQKKEAALIDAERVEVINRIKVAIAHYDISGAELGIGKSSKKSPAPVSKKQSSARKSTPRPRIKYLDGAGNTWSGMGPKPKWFVAALASGKSEADLRA